MERRRVRVSHRVRSRLDGSLLVGDQALGNGGQSPLDDRPVGSALFTEPPAERPPAEPQPAGDGLHVVAIGGRRYEHVLAYPLAVGRLAILPRTAPVVRSIRSRHSAV